MWVEQELAGVDLGDARLDERLGKIVTQFAKHPTAQIPEACEGDKAAIKATYGFLNNKRITHKAIVGGHRQATLVRLSAAVPVLVLQDTTSMNFTHHPETQDLGPLEHTSHQGLFVHSAMAVSDAGVPLGLLDQQVWTRDPEAVGQRAQRKQRPIEDKESFKWLKGLRASLVDVPAAVCLISVCDREADVFDLFLDAANRDTQFLVRAAWDRRLDAEEPDYLKRAVARAAVRNTFEIEVGRAQDRPPRTATVELRFTRVVLRPPRHRLNEPGLKPLTVSAIEIREINPPAEVEDPLHWLLLTNRHVASVPHAKRCVRWYGLRWLVERYHFVLKSGCRFEDRQLRKADRLIRCLAVDAIVAWRLLWLTYQARATPDVPCSIALDTHEWQALFCYIHKTSVPPADPPSLHDALGWVARLGGHLGRAHDAEPGVQVLWRGWQLLQPIADTWLLFHPPPT